MGSTLKVLREWMTLPRYRVLWYVCTTVGLLAAVFLAPLHWTLVVLTIFVAWGGPLLIEFAWDAALHNVFPKSSDEINSTPSRELKDRKRRRWFTEEHVFYSGTSTMWLATLIALVEPQNSVLFLILGVSFTLTLYGIRGAIHTFGNDAR